MRRFALVLSLLLLAAGCKGKDGAPGAQGPQGPQGAQGDAGQPGQTAPSEGADLVEVIDPCGDNPGEYDEVLLRFSNGQIFAVYAQGAHTFLTELTPGSYRTTDKQACNFTVTAEGEVQ